MEIIIRMVQKSKLKKLALANVPSFLVNLMHTKKLRCDE